MADKKPRIKSIDVKIVKELIYLSIHINKKPEPNEPFMVTRLPAEAIKAYGNACTKYKLKVDMRVLAPVIAMVNAKELSKQSNNAKLTKTP